MTDPDPERRSPRFCGQCGAPLPDTNPRFCIECGQRVRPAQPDDDEDEDGQQEPGFAPVATGPTVRLPNAPGEQSVVGGTARLPTSDAFPPGLWFAAHPPGPSDTIAIYAPLRAVVGGWSATTSDGWRKLGQARANDGTSRNLVRFGVERVWFAAEGAADGLRLHVRIEASSFAQEGRTRRGFRYRVGADPPMEVAEAWWATARRKRCELPLPQIQIMAPPRARRISDTDEKILRLSAREAETWSLAGKVHGVFRMPDVSQQRTPVGRGIALYEMPGGALITPLSGLVARLHRVRIHTPLVCKRDEWERLLPRIKAEASGLGLDFETDAVVEWWLDRQGYDGATFERGALGGLFGRMVVAFHRSQIAEIVG